MSLIIIIIITKTDYNMLLFLKPYVRILLYV